MKFIFAILLAFGTTNCGTTKDLEEIVTEPAKLIKIEKIERWPSIDERIFKIKQTWQFLDNHYEIVRYVDTTNKQLLGTIDMRDRRR